MEHLVHDAGGKPLDIGRRIQLDVPDRRRLAVQEHRRVADQPAPVLAHLAASAHRVFGIEREGIGVEAGIKRAEIQRIQQGLRFGIGAQQIHRCISSFVVFSIMCSVRALVNTAVLPGGKKIPFRGCVSCTDMVE